MIGVGLALLCIHAFDAAVRPLATDMAQAKVRNAVTAIVDGAVERTMDAQAVSYSDIVTLQTDGEGESTPWSPAGEAEYAAGQQFWRM